MTSTDGAPVPDGDAPVTIATFPNPHEAELAHAALESRGIDAVVNNDHGQYLSAASWVQLQVARRDREVATTLLERGPQPASSVGDAVDDMRTLRLQRRFTLARWFLYAGSISILFSGWMFAPLFIVPIGLAIWSRSDPRRAFGVAIGLQAIVAFAAIATSGPVGLIALISLFAFYFAWLGAAPDPPDPLLASPIPGSPGIDIGEAWNVGDANREPAERPIWMLRVLGVTLLVAAALWVLWASLLGG